jgi:hypothetical protein
MARHKEKDDEAGGEGLGVLATRKRLWRDTDGNIVNARRPLNTPEASKSRQVSHADKTSSRRSTSISTTSAVSPASLPVAMSRTGSASSTIVVDTGLSSSGYAESQEEDAGRKFEDEMRDGQDSWFDINVNTHALPSPPISEASLHSSPVDDELGDLDALYEDAWPPLADGGLPPINTSSSGSGPETSSLSSSHSSSYFGCANWGSAASGHGQQQPFQTFMGAMAELPYDDMFKPEAGLYEWQAWNSQVLMSRCREEKCDPLAGALVGGERKLEWGAQYPGQAGIV